MSAGGRQPGAAAAPDPARLLEAVARAAALAPFLVRAALAAWWTASGPPTIHAVGDDALLETYAQHAMRGGQLLGPYSKFDFNNPGPAYFYAALPVYLASGQHALGMHWAALAINLAAALGLLALGRRLGGRALALGLAALLALHVAYFDPRMLSHPWNPFVTVLPFGVVLLASARLAAGGGAALFLAVVVGSFVAQTHVAYLPTVVGLVAASLAAALIGRRRPARRWLTASGAALVGLWLPAWVEEALNRPGNLSAMYRFARARGRDHELGDALATFAHFLADELTLAPRALLPEAAEAALEWWLLPAALAQLVLLLVAWRRSTGAGATGLAALAGLGAVAWALALWSVVQVRGPMFFYLVIWIGLLGGINWLVVAVALGRGASRRLGSAPALAAVAVAVAAAASSLARIAADPLPGPNPQSDQVAALHRPLAELLATSGPARLSIDHEDDWPVAAGVVLALYKQGRVVQLDERWLTMMGRQFAPRGDERLELIVGQPARLAGRAGLRPVARSGELAVYRLERPD